MANANGIQAEDTTIPLHKAIRERKYDTVVTLLNNPKNDVNQQDAFGSTALHFAAVGGDTMIVECLVRTPGVNVNAIDMFNRTPLSHAVKEGHLDCTLILLRSGADLRIRDNNGETALMKALRKRREDCALELIRAGARATDKDKKFHNTAIHIAAQKGLSKVLDLLLSSDPSGVHVQNVLQRSPLHEAAAHDHLECCQILLQYGARIDSPKDDNDRTPIEYAQARGHQTLAFEMRRIQKEFILERLKDKGLTEWSIEQVLSWLDAIGYGHYVNNFKEQRISGVVLKTLTVQSLLDEIKIPPYGDRVQIKNLIDVFLEFERERERERTGPVMSNEGGGGVGGASITNVNRALTSLEEDQSILIDHEELVFYEVLGRGNFGEVRRATWKGSDVAVKVIYRHHFRNQTDVEMFVKEIKILQTLRHPNIIQFLGAVNDSRNHCIVTDFVPRGNLQRLISENFSLLSDDVGVRWKIISGITSGMHYLHTRKPDPIVHRDLTTSNILIALDNTVRIADFGLSRKLDSFYDMTGAIGCLPFMAPEVFKFKPYGTPADVFSFGMCLFVIWSGREPNRGMKAEEYAELVASSGYRPRLESIPSFWLELMTDCWQEQPELRPSFETIQDRLKKHVSDTSSFYGTVGQGPSAPALSVEGDYLSDF